MSAIFRSASLGAVLGVVVSGAHAVTVDGLNDVALYSGLPAKAQPTHRHVSFVDDGTRKCIEGMHRCIEQYASANPLPQSGHAADVAHRQQRVSNVADNRNAVAGHRSQRGGTPNAPKALAGVSSGTEAGTPNTRFGTDDLASVANTVASGVAQASRTISSGLLMAEDYLGIGYQGLVFTDPTVRVFIDGMELGFNRDVQVFWPETDPLPEIVEMALPETEKPSAPSSQQGATVDAILPSAVTPVPLPATMPLMLLGGLGAFAFLRRRR